MSGRFFTPPIYKKMTVWQESLDVGRVSVDLTVNGPMLCAGPAKTAQAHCEAPCSNITQIWIEAQMPG